MFGSFLNCGTILLLILEQSLFGLFVPCFTLLATNKIYFIVLSKVHVVTIQNLSTQFKRKKNGTRGIYWNGMNISYSTKLQFSLFSIAFGALF